LPQNVRAKTGWGQLHGSGYLSPNKMGGNSHPKKNKKHTPKTHKTQILGPSKISSKIKNPQTKSPLPLNLVKNKESSVRNPKIKITTQKRLLSQ